MKNVVLSIFALLIFVSISFAAVSDLPELGCKLYTYNNNNKIVAGSGCALGYNSEGDLIVLSCGHVLQRSPRFLCQFYRNGKPLPVVWSWVINYEYDYGTTNDIGVLRIPKEELTRIKIKFNKFIRISATNYEPSNLSFYTIGCPRGGWPTIYWGSIAYYNKDVLKISPTPIKGRSGSAIFNSNATRIIGIVVMVNGKSIPVYKIRKFLYKNEITL